MLYDKKWDKEVKIVDEVGQCLLDAADYIEKHGWAQGWGDSLDGSVCLLRAIGEVNRCCAVERKFEIHAMVRRYLKINVPIYVWNDEPGRTKDEVISALRNAAYQE